MYFDAQIKGTEDIMGGQDTLGASTIWLIVKLMGEDQVLRRPWET